MPVKDIFQICLIQLEILQLYESQTAIKCGSWLEEWTQSETQLCSQGPLFPLLHLHVPHKTNMAADPGLNEEPQQKINGILIKRIFRF